jgi:indole-3-glycerol phosphate synthase
MEDHLVSMIVGAQRQANAGYYVTGSRSPGPGLREALDRHPSFPIIAEIKMASPSAGTLSSHSPEELVEAYSAGSAAALSVLTQPMGFRGGIATLDVAYRCGLPILMKDIVVSERQLNAAASLGAGTVLLIQEVFDILPPEQRDALIGLSHDLGLEVLLEVGSPAALSVAMESDADMLGINQRDLRTFVIDASKGARLLPAAIRSDRPVILMSGIETREQVAAAMDGGASGVLIGGHLASSPDPAMELQRLEVPR